MSDNSESGIDAKTSPRPNRDASPSTTGQPEGAAVQRQVRHALRTPINHILGYCEMLLEEGQVPDAFRRDLERIQAGGRHFLKLINEYFDQPGTDKAPRDLHVLYHELRTPVNHVVGYCELLRDQAVDIGTPQFIPELQKIHDAALTWLALMEENLNLREPRVREELAVQSAAAESQIEVASTPAHRSTSRQPANVAQGTETAKGQRGALLIVDDDQDNRDLLARRFQHQSFSVAIAANGFEAIQLIETREFDLVLLDLVMPGLGGLEVLKRVRQKRPMAELPVIMLTAMDSSADVVEALRLGANDYLTKPAPFTVVQARTETHLKLKRAQLELKGRMEEVRRLAGALEKRNRFIQQVFGRYVTDEIVQTLLETPEGLKLGGEKREVTILLSDLRGFTALTESLPPERVIEMLNVYFGEMIQILSRYEGVIDEFTGDGILTIFGAPIRKDDHPERAVACALSMQLAMERVNERLAALGIPALGMGIGINTGQVVVGNIGSTKRAKYGVVGTPVNVTARIQTAALAGQVLVAETTATHVGSVLIWREKKRIAVKGISEPLTLYVVDGLKGRYQLRLTEKIPSDSKGTGNPSCRDNEDIIEPE
ncbi:MAG TPA: adenylate/guanylate cyclase domain-containing protein [Candidatus Limnocylindrales bacterium]|nr:adenylate/guanylate cyclase domain-containing protein [Candidatus Limnocylindrales bacterium]